MSIACVFDYSMIGIHATRDVGRTSKVENMVLPETYATMMQLMQHSGSTVSAVSRTPNFIKGGLLRYVDSHLIKRKKTVSLSLLLQIQGP